MTPSVREIGFSAVPVDICLVGELPPPPPPPPPEPVFSLAQLEAAREEARHEGFQEATAALNEQIGAQRIEIAQLQDAVLASISSQGEALGHQLHETLPDLVLEITRRVLGGFRPDRENLLAIVTQTLAEIAPGTTDVEIRLSPDDLALMEGVDAQLHQKYPGIRFLPDADLGPGDCMARSRFGLIDARAMTKLESISRSIK